MSSYGSRSGRQDRSTLYGVFAIVALLPAAFSVAFEHSARGVTSVQPWLTALFPLVLLVAARFVPPAWSRSRAGAWALVGIAVVAGGGFCWHLSGLLGHLGVTGPARFGAPIVIAAMYGAFGAVMGRIRQRAAIRRTPTTVARDRVTAR